MTEIERMKRYIKRSKIDSNDRYCLLLSEVAALCRHEDFNSFCAMIETAFNYGRAKERCKAMKEGEKA